MNNWAWQQKDGKNGGASFFYGDSYLCRVVTSAPDEAERLSELAQAAGYKTRVFPIQWGKQPAKVVTILGLGA